MYLQTALSKIQEKHGEKTEAYVKFYKLPPEIPMTTGRDLRLDQTVSELYRDFYTTYCLRDGARIPLNLKTYRLSEPMRSPAGTCTMYRVYQEDFDGFHQIALVTVFNEVEYEDYRWKDAEMRENSKNTHNKPWWLWKDL